MQVGRRWVVERGEVTEGGNGPSVSLKMRYHRGTDDQSVQSTDQKEFFEI